MFQTTNQWFSKMENYIVNSHLATSQRARALWVMALETQIAEIAGSCGYMRIPSGDVKIAMENGHRNSGFSH